MTTEEVLNIAGEKAVKEIKDSFDDKRLNDTGKAKNSIDYQVTGNVLIIKGLARVLFLEFGRKPGQMPPISPIRAWVERKLGVSEDESLGVAFAIAKKIAFGTKDNPIGGTDIFTDRAKGLQIELTIAMINSALLKEVTKALSLEITGGLVTVWETGKQLNILS